MRSSICSVLSLLCLATLCTASAEPAPVNSAVVRLAPDFSIPGIGGKPRDLRSLRGQSVVLLIAKDGRVGALKKQVKYLQELFEQFASKGTVFAVALRQGDSTQIRTNIPMAIVNDGAAVADAYGVKTNFAIAIIGLDGNIDYQTEKVVPPEKVRDVVQNSYPVQASLRRKQ
jgi:peroxiredoxin